jgi:hypothetical protein
MEGSMAKDVIAYCGLNCSECTAYQATQSNDNALRQKIADEWNAKHNWGLKAKDINCDGCLPVKNGRLLNYCASCDVRKCAIEKKIKTCAPCADYPCTKLTSMSWFEERCKPTLDKIRASR